MKLTEKIKDVNPMKMCWWKQVAISDYVKVMESHKALTQIENYEKWRECFYCGEQHAKRCENYTVKVVGS